MRWTNLYNVDPAIVALVVDDPYYGPHRFDATITGLIKPPQIAYLETIHDDEIVQDVSDLLWRFLGTVAHKVLEGANIPNALKEERLGATVLGWLVGGKADCYAERDGEHYIIDYKVTSAWSFVFGVKREWEMQLNFYAHLFREAGFPVDRLQVSAILRDWIKRRAFEAMNTGDDSYPKAPWARLDVPLWTARQTRRALEQRVKDHQSARAGNVRDCEPWERWKKPDKWRVKVAKQKRAVAVFGEDTKRGGGEAEANALLQTMNRPDATLEHLAGTSTRCADYCPVARWCPQWAKLRIEEGNIEWVPLDERRKAPTENGSPLEQQLQESLEAKATPTKRTRSSGRAAGGSTSKRTVKAG